MMSYGASTFDAYHLAGSFAGRILSGRKPAELPVQVTRLERAVILKTATALGVAIQVRCQTQSE
jgi:putative ABC transport system substrate-binding protein